MSSQNKKKKAEDAGSGSSKNRGHIPMSERQQFALLKQMETESSRERSSKHMISANSPSYYDKGSPQIAAAGVSSASSASSSSSSCSFSSSRSNASCPSTQLKSFNPSNMTEKPVRKSRERCQSATSNSSTDKKAAKRNSTGETALIKMAKKGDLQAIKLLIKEGADVNEQDYAGWTALHECSIRNYPQIVAYLLRHGANPKLTGLHGDTALHDAVRSGNVKVVRHLLKSGADPRIINEKGERPVDLAVHEEVSAVIRQFIANRDAGESKVDSIADIESDFEHSDSVSSIGKSVNSGASPNTYGRRSSLVPSYFGESNDGTTKAPKKDPYAFDDDEENDDDPTVTEDQSDSKLLLHGSTTSSGCLSQTMSSVSPNRRVSGCALDITPGPPLRLRFAKEAGQYQLMEQQMAAAAAQADLCSGSQGAPESTVSLADEIAAVDCTASLENSQHSAPSLPTGSDMVLLPPLRVKTEHDDLTSLSVKPSPVLGVSPLVGEEFDDKSHVSGRSDDEGSQKVPPLRIKLGTPEAPISANSNGSTSDALGANVVPTTSQSNILETPAATSNAPTSASTPCTKMSMSDRNFIKTLDEIKPTKREPPADTSTASADEHSSIDKSLESKPLPNVDEKMEGKCVLMNQSPTSSASVPLSLSNMPPICSTALSSLTSHSLSVNASSASTAVPVVTSASASSSNSSTTSTGASTGLGAAGSTPVYSSATSNSSCTTNAGPTTSTSTHSKHRSGRTLRSHTAAMREKTKTTTSMPDNTPLKKRKLRSRADANSVSNTSSQDSSSMQSTSDASVQPSHATVTSSANFQTATSNTPSTGPISMEGSTTTSQASSHTSTVANNADCASSDSGHNAMDCEQPESTENQSKEDNSNAMPTGAANTSVNTSTANTSGLFNSSANTSSNSAHSSQLTQSMQHHQSLDEAVYDNPYEKSAALEKGLRDLVANLVEIQPKAPYGYQEYLMTTKNYLLSEKIPNSLHKRPVPTGLTSQPLIDLFRRQEQERHTQALKHQAEREQLRLSAEQAVLRAQMRAALALANQPKRLSFCSVFSLYDITYMPANKRRPPDQRDEESVRDRFTPRTFIGWLQDIKDTFQMEKKKTLCRQLHEAESLMMVQKLDWEMKVKDTYIHDSFNLMSIPSHYVPLIKVPDDFPLFVHDPIQRIS